MTLKTKARPWGTSRQASNPKARTGNSKSTRKHWDSKCLSAWGQLVRLECRNHGAFKWRCRPGEPLEAHHIIPRQHFKYRYDPFNGILIPQSAHKLCHDSSPKEFDVLLRLHHPDIAAWAEEHKHDLGKKPTVPELKQIHAELQEEIRNANTGD